MPPKKRSDDGAEQNVVSGAWIKDASETELLRRLIATQEHLEGVQYTASSSVLIRTVSSPNSRPTKPGYDDDLLDALLARAVLRHPKREVRAVAASIVADVLRLGLGVQTPASAAAIGADQLPWGKQHNAEVAALLVDTLGAKDAAAEHMRMRRHALETLSVSHGLVPLLRHGKVSAEARNQLFRDLLLHSCGAGGIDGGFASGAASAICDVVTAGEEITEAQVELLLSALNNNSSGNSGSAGDDNTGAAAAAAAPKKAAGGKKGAKKEAAAADDDGAVIATTPAAAAAAIAGAAFRRAEISEHAQNILVSLLGAGFQAASNLLARSEALRAGAAAKSKKKPAASNTDENNGDDDDDDANEDDGDDEDDDDAAGDAQQDGVLDEKGRRAQKAIVVDRLTKLADLSAAAPLAVQAVLPFVSRAVHVCQHAESRLLYVRRMGAAFLRNSALSIEYPRQVVELCARVHDRDRQVKLAAAPVIGALLAQHAEAGTSTTLAGGALWGELPPLLAAAVQDVDEAVRKAAIGAAMDLAAQCPARTPLTLILEVNRRVADKRPAVRVLAMERLAAFYQQCRPDPRLRDKCEWIPRRFFDVLTLAGSGGWDAALAVERSIEALLPSPSRVAASVGADNDGAGAAAAASSSGRAAAPVSLAAAASGTNSGGKKKLVQKQLTFDYGFGGDPDEGLLTLGLDGGKGGGAAAAASAANGGKPAPMTFAEAFCALVTDLMGSDSNGNPTHLLELETMLRKKAMLAKCVAQLFRLRDQAKALGGNKGGAQFQGVAAAIPRLSTLINAKFQIETLHSCLHGVWIEFFQVKDERIVKSFQALDAETTHDFAALRAELRSQIVACAVVTGATAANKREMTRFIDDNMLVRLTLPVGAQHVSEMVKLARELRPLLHNAADGAAAAASTSEAAVALLKQQVAQYRGVMAALRLVAVYAPQLLAHVAGEMTRWVAAISDTELDVETVAAEESLIEAFAAIAKQVLAAEQTNNNNKAAKSNNNNSIAVGAAAMREREKEIKLSLGKVCLFSPSAAASRAAMSALMQLYPEDASLFNQLGDGIVARLGKVQNAPAAAWPVHVAGWFAAFTALCDSAPLLAALGAKSDGVIRAATNIIIAACRASNLNVEQGMHKVDSQPLASGSKRGVDAGLFSVRSQAAAIVSAATEAVATYALTLNASQSAIAVRTALQVFVNGIRATSEDNATHTVGAALKRYGLYRGMLKLIARPPAAAGGDDVDLLRCEVQAAICISAESADPVREQVQQIIARSCARSDARYLAVFCMTAVSEDTRAGYNRAKELLTKAAGLMRNKMLAHARQAGLLSVAAEAEDDDNDEDDDDNDNEEDNGDGAKKAKQSGNSVNRNTIVPFSDGKALDFYLEYCIPFLATYLAHHSFYASEAEDSNNFNAFQRVWFLLFEVVLKTQGTATVAFMQELLRKIKSHDDAVAVPGTQERTRVMADLATAVLNQLLGQKQIGALRTYPGAVLLPRSFVRPQPAAAAGNKKGAAGEVMFPADRVYLDSRVKVGAAPPFPSRGATVGVTPAKGARGASHSAAASDNDDGGDAEDVVNAFGVDAGGSSTPAPKAKKAAPKKKAATPAKKSAGARRGRSASRSSDSDSSSSSSSGAQSSSSSDDDDDEAENVPTPANSAAARKAPAKPAAKGKAAGGKKAATAAKKKNNDDNNGDEDAASPSGAAAAAARSTSRARSGAAVTTPAKLAQHKKRFIAENAGALADEAMLSWVFDAIRAQSAQERARITIKALKARYDQETGNTLVDKAKLTDAATQALAFMDEHAL